MVEKSGMKAWIAAGVALLVTVAIVPALFGAASAAPIATATSNPATQWNYGGEGWSNGSVQFGNATIEWSAMFGWTVAVTVTETSAGNWTVEEVRTVGTTLTVTATTPVHTITYQGHDQEVDTAFANITNDSVVYVNGSAVPAIGIVNASAHFNGLSEQSVSETTNGHSRSGYLNVTRNGNLATSFSPALGLIPQNLSNVHQWNSTATATSSASWTIAWTWGEQGYNGTTRSGSGSATGNLSGSATVSLTGYKVDIVRPWSDGKVRVGIVLIVQGPFDIYDAYVLVPHAFDAFGTATQPYGGLSFGASSISQEDLYVSPGTSGPSVTAATQTFGASDTAVSTSGDPGATVVGQPITSSQAQAINNGLTNTGSPAAASAAMSSGLVVVVLAIAVIAVIVGTVGVIEWRSYARRRSRKDLVGGYAESWPSGVPPAAGTVPPASPGAGGPSAPEDPTRRV